MLDRQKDRSIVGSLRRVGSDGAALSGDRAVAFAVGFSSSCRRSIALRTFGVLASFSEISVRFGRLSIHSSIET
jgi:hypothetical protein